MAAVITMSGRLLDAVPPQFPDRRRRSAKAVNWRKIGLHTAAGPSCSPSPLLRYEDRKRPTLLANCRPASAATVEGEVLNCISISRRSPMMTRQIATVPAFPNMRFFTLTRR